MKTIKEFCQFFDFEYEGGGSLCAVKRNGKVIMKGGCKIVHADLKNLFDTCQKEGIPASILTKNQKKTFTKTVYSSEYDRKVDVIVKIRFDDECGNGHNSFAITGDVYESGYKKNWLKGGCIHDTIYKYFPELRHLIKWHLVSSNQPMHYVTNTQYYARDTDHKGKKAGDPVAFQKRLKFVGFPMTFAEHKNSFFKFLQKNKKQFKKMQVFSVAHEDTRFSDNYTIGETFDTAIFDKSSTSANWYNAPFSEKLQAEEFLKCLQKHKFNLINVPVKWCKAVTPNIVAAQKSAVWKSATLEQLQDTEILLSRLPFLLHELKKDVEELGFTF